MKKHLGHYFPIFMPAISTKKKFEPKRDEKEEGRK